MATIKQYSINSIGIAQIANFLAANHKKGAEISNSTDMLNAWAADAEFQLFEGNPAGIELKSYDAINGHTQIFTIDASGIDITEVEIDE